MANVIKYIIVRDQFISRLSFLSDKKISSVFSQFIPRLKPYVFLLCYRKFLSVLSVESHVASQHPTLLPAVRLTQYFQNLQEILEIGRNL